MFHEEQLGSSAERSECERGAEKAAIRRQFKVT
jgi:hypothetical protein